MFEYCSWTGTRSNCVDVELCTFNINSSRVARSMCNIQTLQSGHVLTFCKQEYQSIYIIHKLQRINN
jgi:hypothetical protein